MRTAMIVLAMGLVAAGCGGGGATTAAPSSSAPAPPAASVPASPAPPGAPSAVVPDKLRFTATTLDGKSFDGTTLAGKPVVFWFWAPWCPKCQAEAPHVKAAQQKYGDRVAFVGVASLDTEPAMKRFVSRTGTDKIIQLSDSKGVVWTRFGIDQQSTFVFMKADGATSKASGPLGADVLNGHVEKLLAA